VTKIEFRVISKTSIFAMTTNRVFESRKMSALKRSRARLVRQLAYEIYENRIREGLPGDAYSDWLQAEKELEKLTSAPVLLVSADPAHS